MLIKKLVINGCFATRNKFAKRMINIYRVVVGQNFGRLVFEIVNLWIYWFVLYSLWLLINSTAHINLPTNKNQYHTCFRSLTLNLSTPNVSRLETAVSTTLLSVTDQNSSRYWLITNIIHYTDVSYLRISEFLANSAPISSHTANQMQFVCRRAQGADFHRLEKVGSSARAITKIPAHWNWRARYDAT